MAVADFFEKEFAGAPLRQYPSADPSGTNVTSTHQKRKFRLSKDCSYWNDADVTKILEQVHANEELIFSHILVVDSEGIGSIPLLPKNRRWNQAAHSSYDHNLGSGANLRERLMIAAEAGADYACAFNHDGQVDPKVSPRCSRQSNRSKILWQHIRSVS